MAGTSEDGNTANRLRKLSQSYQPSENDTFLVSYPKCGSNLVKHFLFAAQKEGKIHPWTDENKQPGCPMLELSDGKIDHDPETNFNLIKTHVPIDWVPFSDDARYILLTRNPKDVSVALWHQYTREKQAPHRDLSSFVDDFVNDKAHPYNAYFRNLRGMLNYSKQPNCMLFTYENLLKNAPETVEKLVEFAKIPLEPDTLKKVASTASLDHFKSSRPEPVQKLNLDDIGTWRKFLNREASDKIDFKFRDIFRGTSAEEWWIQEMSWKPE